MASDLATLMRKRVAARGWLTRTVNKAKELLKEDKPDHDILVETKKDLDTRLKNLDSIQCELEIMIDSESEMLDDIEKAAVFRDSVACVLTEVSRLVVKRDDSSVSASSQNVRLPKLDLPKFSGDVLAWQGFWEVFKASVHDSELPDVTKFSYLRSLLTGEASRCIAGLSLSGGNYAAACSLLTERFGRKEVITFNHIQQLLSLIAPSSTDIQSLRSLQDKLLSHVRSLEVLGVKGDMYGVMLVPVILQKLPTAIRLEWARDGVGHEADLDWLLTFLDSEISRRERSGSYSVPVQPSAVGAEARRGPPESRQRKKLPQTPAAAALTASSRVCGFCTRSHRSAECTQLMPLSVPERYAKIKQAGLCFRCLGPGHKANRCKENCTGCGGHHNAVCCTGQKSRTENVSPVTNGQPVQHQVNPPIALSCRSEEKLTVLPTARVVVKSPSGRVVSTVAMFDSGSNKTYVSADLVKQVNPTWIGSEKVSYTSFGGRISPAEDRNVYDLCMSGTNTFSSQVSLQAVCVPVICGPLQRPALPADAMRSLLHLPLADPPTSDHQLEVGILIGLDNYWSLVRGGLVRGDGGLVAMETALGWVVSGRVGGSGWPSGGECQLLCLGDIHESQLRRLWSLEGVGVTDAEEESESEVLKQFNASVCKRDGRYEVALPWKPDVVGSLVENRSRAEARLVGLDRKLDRDPRLREAYTAALVDMESEGVVAEVPEQELVTKRPVFYLPHRPVVREGSTSTRVRPVFDASAVGRTGISLNDCLEVGPNLIPQLAEVIVRFRRWRFAVTGDIRKAFLQIAVRREDQDALRFLWEVDGRVRTMRFQRVVFGAGPSPFLLNATIKHHLNKYPLSHAVCELQENMYVDDLVSGSDTEEGAHQLLTEAQSILSEAGMELTKWKSSSEVVFDRAHAASGSAENESVKVLGLKWLPGEDAFSFQGVGLPDKVVPSKRVVLSLIARLFDPLQWLAPFTMVAKCLFQDLWQVGLGWDEVLPPEQQEVFSDWVRGLEVLKQMKIYRCYSSQGWNGGEGVLLHAFGDASPRGYGAAVYLSSPHSDGSREVMLVMAKARLSPLTKPPTLPRLELMGALLAARLVVFVRNALHLPDTTPSLCWSDSNIVLGWVRANPARWKPFVSNRVREIQSLTAPSDWGHCPGVQNPADLLTRGISAESLLDSELWLHGPSWLRAGEPDMREPAESAEVEMEQEASLVLPAVAIATSTVTPEPVFPVERWGSLYKCLRVSGWVHRFIHNARKPAEKRSGDLVSDELDTARFALIRDVQQTSYAHEFGALIAGKMVQKGSPLFALTPFVGEDDLLRMTGRLQLSDLSYDEKHPIILPKGHFTELLVREQHFVLKHAGVSTLIASLRGQFWIVGLRCLAKRVKRQCVVCRRHDTRACNETAAPLPSVRVTESPCFSTVGVDIAGPCFCVDFPKKKFYVCLFTCAVVRAVHLELTESMSQEHILMAFRRFAARRGCPSVVISDNAKYFKGAEAALRRYFGDLTPKWRYITPLSPWQGGFYERLIKSVKIGLRKSLGTRCVTRTELDTVLSEIEACVNSRPLTVVSDGPDCPNPLTPNHFLIGRGAGFQSRVLEDPESVNAKALTERARVREKRLNRFWTVWRGEYLRNLPPSVRKFHSHGKLEVGSVVLLEEDNVPRQKWAMGVVTRVFPGRDGKARSAEVRTGRGLRTRAVQRLYDLEVMPFLPESPATSSAPQS